MATQSATAKWQVGLFAIPCHLVSESERMPFYAILKKKQLRVRKFNEERVALSNFFLYLCDRILGAG